MYSRNTDRPNAGENPAQDRDAVVAKAKSRALRLLTVRSRSTEEVRKRLLRLDFDAPVVEEVIDWLTSLGYLDDTQFAKDWVEDRMRNKPMGLRRLTHELRQKGVSTGAQAAATGCIDQATELQLARQAAQSRLDRLGRYSRDDAKRKLYGFLRRRGFNERIVNQVLADSFSRKMEDDRSV